MHVLYHIAYTPNDQEQPRLDNRSWNGRLNYQRTSKKLAAEIRVEPQHQSDSKNRTVVYDIRLQDFSSSSKKSARLSSLENLHPILTNLESEQSETPNQSKSNQPKVFPLSSLKFDQPFTSFDS